MPTSVLAKPLETFEFTANGFVSFSLGEVEHVMKSEVGKNQKTFLFYDSLTRAAQAVAETSVYFVVARSGGRTWDLFLFSFIFLSQAAP